MGLLETIVKKYKDSKQKSLNRKEFRDMLFQYVSDGKLTKEEIKEIDKKKEEFQLSEEDIKGMKKDIFIAAFEAAKSDGQVTEEKEKEILSIQQYLGLVDYEIQLSKNELARLRLLNEIQKGNIPIKSVSNLIMQKNEKVYWIEPSVLNEEKVLSRKYEGGSQGVSFRVMKGVNYRIGGTRGHLVNETGIVGVSDGDLVITNKRLIFKGNQKSFAVKLDKILDIQLFKNGLQFSENNRSKPRMIKFVSEENYEIVGSIFSYAINHFEN